MGRIILSVEDDDAAFYLLKVVMEDLGLDFELRRVEDGVDALKYLRRGGKYADSPRPDLILLNLNLPKMTGMEVLAEIKQDAALRTIPAVIFSSSSLDADRAKCMALGATHYLTKPNDLEGFLGAVRKACEYSTGRA